MKDLGSTIVDRQNQKTWFWKSVHVLSLNVIILMRYRFGYKFFAPIGFYLSHWFLFLGVSALHYLYMHYVRNVDAPAALYLKGVTLGLYFLQLMVAYLNHWFSKDPPHRNSPGTSILTHLVPGANFYPAPGEMSVEWKIHVWVEPILAGLVASVVCVFDLYLGGLLLLSSGALMIKDLHNWHDYRDKEAGLGEAVIERPRVKTNQPYIAPRPQALPGQQSSLGRLFGKSASGPKMMPQGTGIKGLPRVASRTTQATGQPALNTPLNAPRLPPLIQADPAEVEHAKVLNVPPGGIRDYEHLRGLWRQGLKTYYPDVVRDRAKLPEANAMTQRLNAAYVYYKARFEPNVTPSSKT